MKLKPTTLPWNGGTVHATENLFELLSEQLGAIASQHLPLRITICKDPEVEGTVLDEFMDSTTAFLADELAHRESRRKQIVERGLVPENDMAEFLFGRRDAQPWLIYHAEDGGLGCYDASAFANEADHGLTPCFRMPNHGVFWERSSRTGYQMTLVTGRKLAGEWDMDSDIGHESSHAAFSPVPLFTHPNAPRDRASGRLNGLQSVTEMNSRHFAGICYLCSELAAVSVRGETRETDTGLPALEEDDHFPTYLMLCHQLMPDFGFDRAMKALERCGGHIDPDNADEYFVIGAAAIKAILNLRSEFSKFAVPSLEWFTRLGCREVRNRDALPRILPESSSIAVQCVV